MTRDWARFWRRGRGDGMRYRVKRHDRTISVRLSSKLLERVAYYAETDGYETLSDLIRDLLESYVIISERFKHNKRERAALLTSLFRKIRS